MSVPDTPAPPSVAGRYLALLIGINLFNYVDRQVLSAVLPRMQLDGTLFAPGDPDAQAKAGLLTSAFMVAYMLLSPVFGWLDGHRYRRWAILGVGVTLWSLASGFSGLAQGYWMLLATRCLVGVGEGAYGPVASAMIADLYAPARRGKVMAIYNMAIPVGSAVGFLIGAAVAGATHDWRPPFWCTFGGLLLGAACFFLKDPPRPPVDPTLSLGYGAVLTRLVRNRSFVLGCAGMTAIAFVIGGVAAWAPAYLFQREARFAFTDEAFAAMTKAKPDGGGGVPEPVTDKLRPLADGQERTYAEVRTELAARLDKAEGEQHAQAVYEAATAANSWKAEQLTIGFSAMIVLGGLAATAVGAWLGEWLRPRVKGAYFWVIAGGAFFAVPFYLGFLYLPLIPAMGCAFLCVFGLFLHTGPAFTLLANVVRSDERATAFAVNILVIHALGDAISPWLIGVVADRSSLQLAFLLTCGMVVVGGVLWLAGVRFLDADTKAAGEAAA